MDLDTVRRLVGHATITVLQRYVNQLPATLASNHRAHGPVDTLL